MHCRLLKTKRDVITVPFEDTANHCYKVIENNSRLLCITSNQKIFYILNTTEYENYRNPLDHEIRIQSNAS